MPTILREHGYRFFFYVTDRFEPQHVHIQRDDNAAKVWLDPLEISFSDGFRRHECNEILRITEQHSAIFWRPGIASLEDSPMNELRIQQVTFSGDEMSVTFSDKHHVMVPVASFPRLCVATESEREDWTLIGRGLGVHWEAVDEDLSVENILTAYSRSRREMYDALPQV